MLGPGEKLALILPDAGAGAAFRRCFMQGKKRVYLAFFRNESEHLSSDLIRAACLLAKRRWRESIITYVDPNAVKSSNPGWCFQQAGFRKTGRTRRSLVQLELH